MFKKVVSYIPEFFIFTPVVLFVLAFITNNAFITNLFYNTYWWCIFGLVLFTNDFLINKLKYFLW